MRATVGSSMTRDHVHGSFSLGPDPEASSLPSLDLLRLPLPRHGWHRPSWRGPSSQLFGQRPPEDTEHDTQISLGRYGPDLLNLLAREHPHQFLLIIPGLPAQGDTLFLVDLNRERGTDHAKHHCGGS